jgi:murein DD-endopeptidase MepM/ murein hydrolase activator NlpD
VLLLLLLLKLLTRMVSMGRPRTLARAHLRWAVASILVACLGAGSIPAGANPDDRLRELQQKKNEVAEQIEHVDAHGDDIAGLLETLDSQRNAIRKDVATLDGQIAKLDAHIGRVKVRLTKAQKRMAVLTSHLQVVLARLNHRTTVYEERAVAAYKAGPSAYAESILSSESFSDLVDRVAYYESALEADTELLDGIEVLRADLERRRELVQEKEEEIAAAKLSLEADRSTIAQARERRAHDLAEKQSIISEKRDLLANVRSHQKELEAQEARLEQESARLQAILEQQASSAAAGPLPTGGGQLLWPAAGPVTSGYGYRIHPIFGTRILHTGVDIGAPYGAPVLAADAGTVVYAGAMSGYGNVVMIDHGGGISTLYGHLSAFSVSNGQSVGRGTTVASVGCTGYCTGPHLHFEVRINGAPVDPMPYLQ